MIQRRFALVAETIKISNRVLDRNVWTKPEHRGDFWSGVSWSGKRNGEVCSSSHKKQTLSKLRHPEIDGSKKLGTQFDIRSAESSRESGRDIGRGRT